VQANGTIGRAVLSSALSVLAVVALVVILLALFGASVPGGEVVGTGAAATRTPTPRPTSAAPNPTVPSGQGAPSAAHKATRPTQPAAPAEVAEKPDIGVVVLNQSTREGLASEVAGQLRAAGWQVADVGNWQGSVPETTVYYPIGFSNAAEALAADLEGVDRTRPRQVNMRSGMLTVILHQSYPG
jgi:LytR cell envelope-related transcriptional attenuator